MTTPDLETRVTMRKEQLSAKLLELNSEQLLGAAEARDKIKARLSELDHIVKAGVVDGWAHVGDVTRAKLDRWLAR
jgi:hypothetical protein